MAATTRAFLISRFIDLSLKPLQPPPPPHLLIRPLLPSSSFKKRRPSSASCCLVSGVDGGGVSDDYVSTRKSGFDREFSVISNMLKKIEPLDTSVISKGVSDSAKDSMKQTISTMLGLLPSDQFSVTVRVSKRPLDRLLMSSIITGYTLWNAEYRISLMRNFDISASNWKRSGFPGESEISEVKREESEGGAGQVDVDCCVEDLESVNLPSLGDLSPKALNYIQQLESELSSAKKARIHSFLEKTKKNILNQNPEEGSDTVGKEQQKLRKKVTILVKKQKVQQVRQIVKRHEDIKPWGQDAQVKVGCRLIQLLMETAYIQPPVDQLGDGPPDIRPAFIHTLKTITKETQKFSRRYGVIECDPLVRKGLEKTELDVRKQENMQMEYIRESNNDLLEYLRSLESDMVTELSRPSSLEVEEIIHQLAQNTLRKFFKDESSVDFMGDLALRSTENLQNGNDECFDTIGTSRDYLAKLLFWCMLLGHHLRGLENRLHLSCAVGLL